MELSTGKVLPLNQQDHHLIHRPIPPRHQHQLIPNQIDFSHGLQDYLKLFQEQIILQEF
jgi:hypothetical protein